MLCFEEWMKHESDEVGLQQSGHMLTLLGCSVVFSGKGPLNLLKYIKVFKEEWQ